MADGTEHAPLWAGRKCAVRGALLFGAVGLLGIAVGAFAIVESETSEWYLYLLVEVRHLYRDLFFFAYAVIPPLAAIGGLVGFETFRLAVGARQPIRFQVVLAGVAVAWIPIAVPAFSWGPGSAVTCLSYFCAIVIPLALQFELRRLFVVQSCLPILALFLIPAYVQLGMWTWSAR